MYCVGCGTNLPNGAQFCQHCGKPNVQDGVASDVAPAGKLSQTEPVTHENINMLEPQPEERSEDRPAAETGTISDGSAPATSPEGAEPRRFVWENLEPQTITPAAPAASVTAEAKLPARYSNAGSITLGVVALICLVLGAVQGFIPIFLIEGLAFGGLAWLCAVKWPLSQSMHSIVFVTSILLAALVGVTLDQDTFGPQYHYLSQGSAQYRIEEKAGRTDRLGNSGWYPVAYDKDAQELSSIDMLSTVNLTKGEWRSALSGLGSQICFSVTNSSDYTLDRITIDLQIQKKNDVAAGNGSGADKDSTNQPNPASQQIVLKSYGGGFISAGENPLVCASSPRDLTADETWSYSDVHLYGWKR